MTRVVSLDRGTDVAAATTGIVEMPMEGNSSKVVKKIPTRGHSDWSLTTKSLGAATVVLKGTNNPDPASTDGETLITNTHGAANQQDGSCAGKAYEYVFVHVTANAGGVDRIFLFGSSFAGLR